MKIDWQTGTRLTEFDWLFTSFFLFLVVAVPFAAILRADNAQTLDRTRYFLRMSALVVVGYGVTFMVTIDPFHIAGRAHFLINLNFLVTDVGLFTLWKVCVVVSFYLQTRWTVCRIRHIGRFSIWWALLMVLPTISLIPALVFALIPPRDSKPPKPRSEDFRAAQRVAAEPLLRAS